MSICDTFYNEEVRCDFVVTSDRKKLWSLQLELFVELDRICQKHNIKYFAGGGTMLGAVRHKGYIPWDDDIDINMFRKDYDKFCEVATTELKHPYFLQTPMTDIDFASYHVKLRNSNTTCTTKYDTMFKYNQGVFIDIFPYDYIPDNEEEKEFFYSKIREYRRKLDIGMRKFYHINGVLVSDEEKREVKEFFKVNSFKDVYREYDELCGKYSEEPTSRVGVLAYTINGKFEHPSEWFNEYTYMDFEMLKIPLPVEYDKYLSLHYGNYMEIKKSGSMHGDLIFYPDVPYTEYLKKIHNDNNLA